MCKSFKILNSNFALAFRLNTMDCFVKQEPLEDCFVKLEPLEEFKHLSEVKTEPLDYDTEQFGKLKSY